MTEKWSPESRSFIAQEFHKRKLIEAIGALECVEHVTECALKLKVALKDCIQTMSEHDLQEVTARHDLLLEQVQLYNQALDATREGIEGHCYEQACEQAKEQQSENGAVSYITEG